MKRCSACGETFEGLFRFCPIDGQALERSDQPARFDFRLTILTEASLGRRLIGESQFLLDRCRQAWPRFKAQPFAFTRAQWCGVVASTRRLTTQPYFATASLTAVITVLALVLTVMVLEKRQPSLVSYAQTDHSLELTTLLDSMPEAANKSQPGNGVGEDGPVGINKRRGEGSAPTPARARGGGGGGEMTQLTESRGRMPLPSVIPAPISTTYARLPQTLPEAGINIDPVLWRDLPFRDYGDPGSKSVVPSNGPGKVGGIGTGEGTGIGEGLESGFGPGKKGNMGGGENTRGSGGEGGSQGNNPEPDQIFSVKEVTTRARVLFKPEPQYTEEARRSQITGTVMLSVVFSRSGQVTNIRVVQPLCCGLTEKAVIAARQIRFIAATRAGQPVSTRMQLEYNFNLY